jgi:hypothetical protein
VFFSRLYYALVAASRVNRKNSRLLPQRYTIGGREHSERRGGGLVYHSAELATQLSGAVAQSVERLDRARADSSHSAGLPARTDTKFVSFARAARAEHQEALHDQRLDEHVRPDARAGGLIGVGERQVTHFVQFVVRVGFANFVVIFCAHRFYEPQFVITQRRLMFLSLFGFGLDR